MQEENRGSISIIKACKLLRFPMSDVYYRRKEESKENKYLMERIEEIYDKDPVIGYGRMTEVLNRETGKRIEREAS